MRNTLLILLVITASMRPAVAFAWGDVGHELVCGLSLHYMSKDAKAFVKKTLALGKYLDGNGKNDFAEACVWPDKAKYTTFKGTYEEHFLNVPRNSNHIDFAIDCAAMNCIAVGIQKNLVYLSRPAESKREKARKAAALRFLGHFIGDVHQPLHIANTEDWGGNKIKVYWFGEPTNLHAVWDAGIIEHADLTYPDGIKRLAALDETVGSTNVLEWMRESFQLARQEAYKDTSGHEIHDGEKLGKAYYLRSKPVVMHQLAKAAVRLAYLLNQLVAGRLDTNILIK